jgi:YggT family protein
MPYYYQYNKDTFNRGKYMTGFLAVGFFLINTLFSLFLFTLWVHVFLRYYNISVLHPMAQSIFNMTYPIINPLEHFFYQKRPRPRRYDWVALGLIAVIEFIKFLLLGLLSYHVILPVFYLLMFVIADFIIQPCDLLFYALIIRLIMSWVNSQWAYHPTAVLINRVTDPLLSSARRLIPYTSGFDFSLIIVLIVLKATTLFISALMPLRLL